MLTKTQVKYIQSLGQKKFRDEHGQFIAEGPKVVAEFLTNSLIQVKELYAVKNWVEENKEKYPGTAITVVEDYELEKISRLNTPNQVVLVADIPVLSGVPELKGKISLALDTIQDPGNMGTIIRIADWFGVDQLICSPDCVDIYNPKVVQATMGSLARIRVSYSDLDRVFRERNGVKLYAASLSGTDIRKMPKLEEGIILIGNESKGIHDSLLALSDERITIARKGNAESLNAAVATGIILSRLT